MGTREGGTNDLAFQQDQSEAKNGGKGWGPRGDWMTALVVESEDVRDTRWLRWLSVFCPLRS